MAARENFEFAADGVLKTVTGMGLKTRKGRPLTKESFSRMLENETYTGWINSGDLRVKRKHEPIVSEALFASVRNRLNGKSTPHKTLSEDFPLRGVILCAACGKPLTAGWVKGRKD